MVTHNTSQRRAIVHIGLEKTGSTSLQHALAGQRDTLRAAGILVPRSPGQLNHTRLVATCLNDGVIDNIKAHQLARTGLDDSGLRAKFHSNFARELARGEAWHTLVITSELISSRLYAAEEIDRLIALLQTYVDDIEIVLFLRRQDRLAVSRFSSALRSGYAGFDDPFADTPGFTSPGRADGIDCRDCTQLYHYDRILGRFEDRAGVTLNAQLYGPGTSAVDPVRYFFGLLGCAQLVRNDQGNRLNTALSAQAQYLIAELNGRHQVALDSGLRNEAYRALLLRIESEITGDPRQVNRADAQAFYAQFSASNERTREKYFPLQEALFDDDFSEYPEAVDYSRMKASMARTLRKFDRLANAGNGASGAANLLARKVNALAAGLGLKR